MPYEDLLAALLYTTQMPPLPAEKGDFRLILMEIGSEIEENPAAFYDALKMLHGLKATASDESRLLILVDQGDKAEISAFLRSGAVSNAFSDINESKTHFLLLCDLLALSKPMGNPVCWAEDFGSSLYFLRIAKENNLALFHSEEVLSVMEHDYENNTRLSQSLFIYLSFFKNIKAAAEELSIHRNTLEYQIRKIEALLGKNIQDDNALFDMLCTYVMLAIDGIS